MKKYDCKVILCGPGVGKSYLAERDNRFVDVDEIKSKYRYNSFDLTRDEIEKLKHTNRQTVNKDYIDYSIKLINDAIANNKIVLISFHKEIVDYIRNNNIKYCVVYPSLDSRNEYIKRLRDRGNNEEFIQLMTNKEAWEGFYDKDKNDPYAAYKIELKSGEYLSDIIDKFI